MYVVRQHAWTTFGCERCGVSEAAALQFVCRVFFGGIACTPQATPSHVQTFFLVLLPPLLARIFLRDPGGFHRPRRHSHARHHRHAVPQDERGVCVGARPFRAEDRPGARRARDHQGSYCARQCVAVRCAKDKQQLAAAQQPPPLTLQQELFDIARGGTTLGWSGHYVHEAARSAEGVVSSSCVCRKRGPHST